MPALSKLQLLEPELIMILALALAIETFDVPFSILLGIPASTGPQVPLPNKALAELPSRLILAMLPIPAILASWILERLVPSPANVCAVIELNPLINGAGLESVP